MLIRKGTHGGDAIVVDCWKRGFLMRTLLAAATMQWALAICIVPSWLPCGIESEKICLLDQHDVICHNVAADRAWPPPISRHHPKMRSAFDSLGYQK